MDNMELARPDEDEAADEIIDAEETTSEDNADEAEASE